VSSQRDVLRVLIDQTRRARLDTPGSIGCSECGTELDCWTAGCGQCAGRHRQRARRGDYPGGWEAYEARRAEVWETMLSLGLTPGQRRWAREKAAL
jgi:hypothetical protein